MSMRARRRLAWAILALAAGGALFVLPGCVTLSGLSLRGTEDFRTGSLGGEISMTFVPRPTPPPRTPLIPGPSAK